MFQQLLKSVMMS